MNQDSEVPVQVNDKKIVTKVTAIFEEDVAMSIQDASDSALAKTMRQFNGSGLSAWVKALIDEHDPAEAYPCSFKEAWNELNRRQLSGIKSKDINKIPEILSTNHTFVFVQKQPIGVIADATNTEVAMENLGGYLIPKGSPEGRDTVAATVLANAYLFSIESTTCAARPGVKASQYKAVDLDLAKSFNVPLINFQGRKFGDATRAELVANTVESLKTVEKSMHIVTGKMKALPMLTGYVPLEARFNLAKRVGPMEPKSLAHLYNIIKKWREIRGPDDRSRHEVTSGYYYGIVGRNLYKTCYTAHDVLTLGETLKTNYLEIGFVDGVMTTHVLHSLVKNNGWYIRVVGSSLYKKYTLNDPPGIYSYFDFPGMYLRYCPIQEAPPMVMPSGEVILSDDITGVVKRSFVLGDLKYAIPFTYAYLHPEMENMPVHFPGCFLYPTAHAHAAQVVIVKGVLKNVTELFTFKNYLIRTSLANTAKTFYAFSRVRFWEQDPCRQEMAFAIKNRPQILKDLGDDTYRFVEDESYKDTQYFNPPTKPVLNVVLEQPKVIDEQNDMEEELGEIDDELQSEGLSPERCVVLTARTDFLMNKIKINQKVIKEDQASFKTHVQSKAVNRVEDEFKEIVSDNSFASYFTEKLKPRKRIKGVDVFDDTRDEEADRRDVENNMRDLKFQESVAKVDSKTNEYKDSLK